VSHVNVARLKRQLKRSRITHDQVAARAGVTRTMVVHVLAGRAKSAKVVAAAVGLLAEKQIAA
jgi:transcriptional regulator with XRE-family HTH domain